MAGIFGGGGFMSLLSSLTPEAMTATVDQLKGAAQNAIAHFNGRFNRLEELAARHADLTEQVYSQATELQATLADLARKVETLREMREAANDAGSICIPIADDVLMTPRVMQSLSGKRERNRGAEK